MRDLVEGFLSVDSRLANSIPALLFKPGFLTLQYIAGRRNRYLDPVRMFITIIVVYFLLNSFGEASQRLDDQKNFVINREDTVSFSQLRDTLSAAMDQQTAETSSQKIRTQDELDIEGLRYSEVKALVERGVMDTEPMLDSLRIEKTFWNRFLYSELIKLTTFNFDDFREYLISKLPWLIFAMMPVFAFLLKLIYLRRKILYIDHLIFAFHLHSFLFLTGILSTLIVRFSDFEPWKWLFLIVQIYAVVALKKVYRQSWLKTLLKYIALYILYFIAAIIFLLLALVVMFLIY